MVREPQEALLRPVKGTSVADFNEARLRRDVIGIVRRVAENYGYDEMSTPILYEKALLTYKFEEASELEDEIYPVSDRGGRDLALRYDLTVPFARFVAGNEKSLTFPIKRFEVGEVFRDGPVKSGRTRQFTQCDVDIVGSLEPVNTAYEQISLIVEVFDSLGLDDIEVRFSSRSLIEGALRSIGVEEEALPGILRVLDKRDKLDDSAFESALTDAGVAKGSPLSEALALLFDASLDTVEDVIGTYGKERTRALQDAIEEVSSLSSLISATPSLSDRARLDLSLVRGQDYYTGIVFEAQLPGFGGSVAGGGAYGSIIASLAGVGDSSRLQASGASFGIVPIMQVLRERAAANGNDDVLSRDKGALIIPVSKEDVPYALRFACSLRSSIRCEVDTDDRSVSKRIKSADKRGYAFVIVFGEAERQSDSYKVKNLENGKEVDISYEALSMADTADLLAFTS